MVGVVGLEPTASASRMQRIHSIPAAISKGFKLFLTALYLNRGKTYI